MGLASAVLLAAVDSDGSYRCSRTCGFGRTVNSGGIHRYTHWHNCPSHTYRRTINAALRHALTIPISIVLSPILEAKEEEAGCYPCQPHKLQSQRLSSVSAKRKLKEVIHDKACADLAAPFQKLLLALVQRRQRGVNSLKFSMKNVLGSNLHSIAIIHQKCCSKTVRESLRWNLLAVKSSE
ncbi:hypothetical protein PC118_g9375 [Phytophthora cactorum]|uniref:Uncharacterized protein n=1 Tax=Phytophthora cactorum TaxID=29920 RepID=A0A8T1G5T1_9STRA|nr:hypothetical protein PC118_g9375 [Phytophthora cactorum]